MSYHEFLEAKSRKPFTLVPERAIAVNMVRHSELEQIFYISTNTSSSNPGLVSRLSQANKQVPAGLWRHHAGGLYQVISAVYIPELDDIAIWYIPKKDVHGPSIRPLEGPGGWCSPVTIEGDQVPRFSYIGDGIMQG